MRVAILIGSLEVGGAQSMALRLMDGLDSAGVEVYLFTLDKNRKCRLPGDSVRQAHLEKRIIQLSRVDVRSSTISKVIMAPYQWIKLERAILRFKIDLILSFMERANIMNLLSFSVKSRVISIRKHITSALSAKTPLKRGLIKLLYPYLLQRATRIVFNSIEAASDFSSLFPIKQNRISIIYNFCDSGELKALAKDPIPEDYLHIFKRPVVITSGRLIHAKGQYHLLRAFKSICQRGNGIHLVILGDGPLRGELIRLCQDLHIQDYVFFPGFQKNPMPWIARADLFVLPSLAEGFPNALLEAMALGVPVISTDCRSGPKEILAPGTDPQKKTDHIDFASFGLLTPPLDGKRYSAGEPLTREEQLLGEAIGIMLKDSSLRSAYAKKALQRANDFSEAKVITQWMKLINEERK